MYRASVDSSGVDAWGMESVTMEIASGGHHSAACCVCGGCVRECICVYGAAAMALLPDEKREV